MNKIKLLLIFFAFSFHLPSTNADSFAYSENGSAAISAGILEASSGTLQVITGVLSVPVTLTAHGANWSQQHAADGRLQSETPLPVADELIQFINTHD